jgi:sigma-B regulation protein RsbU (phosphoserine phosphatase)
VDVVLRKGRHVYLAASGRLWRRVPAAAKLVAVEGAAASAAVALLLASPLGPAIDSYGGRADIIAAVLAVALVAVPFALIGRRVRSAVDRRLHGEPYDAQKVLAELGRVLQATGDQRLMLAEVVENIRGALHTEHVAVFLLDPDSGDFVSEFAWPPGAGGGERLSLPRDAFLVRRLARMSMPIGVDAQDFSAWERAIDPGDVPVWSARRREAHALRALGSKLLVQVRARGELVGIISLGARPGGVGFSEDDKRMLATAGSQVAFAVENAALVRRLAGEERMRRELEMASQVQARLFPERPPALERAEMSGACQPASVVGGDYYDFIDLGPGRSGVAVADVAGKGLSAALLMSVVQASLRSRAPLVDGELTELAAAMNRLLHRSTGASSYATFFYGEYDERARRLTYVNAGHNPPILMRAAAGAGLETLDAGGLAIGLFEDSSYEQGVVFLDPGDVVMLYTDGVTEALNSAGDEFGEERLREALARWAYLPAAELRERVAAAVREWCGDAPLHDDLTLAVLKVSPEAAAPGDDGLRRDALPAALAARDAFAAAPAG